MSTCMPPPWLPQPSGRPQPLGVVGEFVDLTRPVVPARLRMLVAALAAAAVCAVPGTSSVSSAAPSPVSGEAARFVVRTATGAMGSVGDEVTRLGGVVEKELHGLGAAIVTLPGESVSRLRRSAGVLGVTPDAPLRLQGARYDANTDSGSMYNVAQVTGAKRMWGSGVTGKGVDVALIDSGVAPVAGLDARRPGRQRPGPLLRVAEPDTRYLDTFGHGTHHGRHHRRPTRAHARPRPRPTPGWRPDARVISLKVADARRRTDVSQVIAAIDWVVAAPQGPGPEHPGPQPVVRHRPSMQSYVLDPLAYAAEVAWRKGIVVVVSAGNDGTGTGKLPQPGAATRTSSPSAPSDSRGHAVASATTRSRRSRAAATRARNPDLRRPRRARCRACASPARSSTVTYGATATIEDRLLPGQRHVAGGRRRLRRGRALLLAAATRR